VDGSIILKCVCKKQNRCGQVSSESGEGQLAGCCVEGNERLGTIQCWDLYKLLKKDSASWSELLRLSLS
jgi:hypothetical protein